ncbi:MAG: fatty acid desaturase [Candidatus Sericytochromatia bacterium]|nr:MAG: fatty acid desaturase [Candidatus Sericytochromatia bacterium]
MEKVKFVNTLKTNFYNTLKKNVDKYFTENNISKYANKQMIIKTIVMLCLYLLPYILIVSIRNINEILMIGLLIIMGIGLAGVGMNIMHDANHGSYSKFSIINKILGYTMNLIGANAYTWKIKHNILHHTYTNIDNFDEDIDSYGILKLTPNQKSKKIFKFQYIYSFFLYGLVTLEWCISKDFLAFKRYLNKGLIEKKKILPELTILVMSKIIYFFFLIALPIMILNLPWWKVIIGFLILHFTAGIILATTFQLAHVVEKTIYPTTNENGNIENEWAIHQLLTTSNFATKNKFITWFLGGLNHQIEHHLFPHICHIHYSKISEIVKNTCKQFNLPYNYYETFSEALNSHIRLLKNFGNIPSNQVYSK